MASWSDGRSTDVTGETAWSINSAPEAFGSLARGVASVSLTGQLQATGFGMAYVRAVFMLGRAERRIIVTPPGTFVVAGRVRQPGSSVLPDVAVLEPVSGQSTTTRNEGEFMLAGLTGTELILTRAQFETVRTTVRPFDDLLDVPMQPVYGIVTGGSVMGALAPHDLAYEVRPGVTCGVCRLIRVHSSVAGSLSVTLRWSHAPTRMTIWAGQDEFQAAPGATEIAATLPVQAGETVIFVGASTTTAHVSFDLTTTLVAGGAP
jgi:hypothetical protein